MLSTNSIFQLLTTLVYNLPLGGFIFSSNAQLNTYNTSKNSGVTFESNNVASENETLYSQLESSSNYRNNTFTNPIISYDYKCGHYLGI
jgi:hypothetical protein